MEKKNTMLLTIIAVATLLVAVVGATFAYFTAQNGASGSTTATVTTETIGAITVSNEDPALYLDLTAAQMQEGVTGSYWATKTKGAEPATNYASADKAVIAKLNVSGGGEETTYSCNFKITVDKTDVTLAYGDAAVVFALENNAEILGVTSGSEIDYTTLLNEYTVNFTRVGDTEEDLPLVSVSMRVSNTEVEQGFAGETLTTTFTSSDLECEVLEENPMRLTSPTISLNDDILNIIPTDERTEEYEIYVDGELKATIPAIVETNDDDTNTLKGTWQFNDVVTDIGFAADVLLNFTIMRKISEKEVSIFNDVLLEEFPELSPIAVGSYVISARATGLQFFRNIDENNPENYYLINALGVESTIEPTTGNEEAENLLINVAVRPSEIFHSMYPPFEESFKIITLTSEQEVSDEFYEWFIDNANQINTTYDLSNLNLENGTYEITVKAKGNGYETSEFSNKTKHTITVLSGTWKFNSQITNPSEYSVPTGDYFVTYTRNSYTTKYAGFRFGETQFGMTYTDSSGWSPIYDFSTNKFVNNFDSSDKFHFESQRVTQEFYNWFTANATKVS